MTFNIDLAGKSAIVTGASSGMGAEIAVTLAKAGADVAIVGRDEARLDATAKRIKESGGGTVVKIVIDLNSDNAAGKVVDAAIAGLGKLTTLVHSAGVFEPAPIEEGLAALDRALAINVRAPYALTAAALPHLRHGGAVVFVSSIGGHAGFPGCTAYGASKGAIELLVKCLAVEEAGNGVRVNAVAPGNVRTPMNAHLFADAAFEAKEIAMTPIGRIGEVEDIAPAVAFLASDAASYITGSSLVIDGGIVAG